MDWPVATAYATIFAATLGYIDRVSDTLQPAPLIIRNQPRRSATVHPQTEHIGPRPGDVGIDSATACYDCQGGCVDRFQTSMLCQMMNGARPSVSAGN